MHQITAYEFRVIQSDGASWIARPFPFGGKDGHCASYDKEYGCLPLDCDCPMFGICYTNSTLCRYFRSAVLPEDAELEAVFNHTPTMKCKQCGIRPSDAAHPAAAAFRTDKDVNVPHRLQELRHEKSPVFFPETLVPLERKYQFQVFLFPRLFRNP